MGGDDWLFEEKVVPKHAVQPLQEALRDAVGKILSYKQRHNGNVVPQVAADDKWIIVPAIPEQPLKSDEVRIEPVELSERLLDEARSKGITYQKSIFARNVNQKLLKSLEKAEAKKLENQRVIFRNKPADAERVAVDGKWLVTEALKEGKVIIQPVEVDRTGRFSYIRIKDCVTDVHYTDLKKVKRSPIERLADLEAAGIARMERKLSKQAEA